MHLQSSISAPGVNLPTPSHSYDCQECGADRHVLCQFCAEPLWYRQHDLRPWDAHGPTHHWCEGLEAAFASLASLPRTPVAVPASPPEPYQVAASAAVLVASSSPRQAGQAEPAPQSETNAERQQRRLREAML